MDSTPDHLAHGPLRELLADVVGPEVVERTTADTDLIEELHLDQVQLLTFLLHVEENLSIELELAELDIEHVRSLRRFGAFVEACAMAPA